MRIDPASNTPVFEQIADSVRSVVAAGVYRAGELIPSIRQQATDLLINPNTIKRAYELLEREGIIEPKPGLGMAVTGRAATIARARMEQSVKSSFVQGIRLGRASDLPRARIDDAYGKAWSDAGPGSAR